MVHGPNKIENHCSRPGIPNQGSSYLLAVRDIIPGDAKSVRINDRKLNIYYSPAAFLYPFAIDCAQKRKVRSNLCVTVLIICVNINCNRFFLFMSL